MKISLASVVHWSSLIDWISYVVYDAWFHVPSFHRRACNSSVWWWKMVRAATWMGSFLSVRYCSCSDSHIFLIHFRQGTVSVAKVNGTIHSTAHAYANHVAFTFCAQPDWFTIYSTKFQPNTSARGADEKCVRFDQKSTFRNEPAHYTMRICTFDWIEWPVIFSIQPVHSPFARWAYHSRESKNLNVKMNISWYTTTTISAITGTVTLR